MEAQEEEFDTETLEKNLQAVIESEQEEETPEVEAESKSEEAAEIEDFDLDELLNSEQPIALAGVLTDDQAREEAEKRGWTEEGTDRFGHKVSAIEFLERAPFFKKINRMREDIDKQNEKIHSLAEQSKKIAQKSIEEKKRLNDQLKAAKEKLLNAEYLDADDVNKLKDIDRQIDETTVEET